MTNATAESLNVSRETFERLEHFVELLRKWSPRINLVSQRTLDAVWDRHIRDSLQVLDAARGASGHWLDLGSGGGLPGIVVALSQPTEAVSKVTMIESDQRKAAFLRTVLRETSVDGAVIAARIETTAPQNADIVSARALAPLCQLLTLSSRHLASQGTAILPKGITWKNELEEAQKSFSFQHEAISSTTQQGAVILRIREISRV